MFSSSGHLRGPLHVEWDATAPVTPFGQLPFFIDYLKQAGLFDAFVADCPLSLTSNNAPKKREILTLGQLYRDRADCENVFDELKNQWGWGGFTTQDLTRCRLLAGMVALIYNWWSLFVRLADPEHHRETITSRPLLLSAIARKTQHAGQVTLTISSTHGLRDKARHAYVRIAGFLAGLRQNAEQLNPLEKWCRILSEALRHFLHGRQLQPPLRLNPG